MTNDGQARLGEIVMITRVFNLKKTTMITRKDDNNYTFPVRRLGVYRNHLVNSSWRRRDSGTLIPLCSECSRKLAH